MELYSSIVKINMMPDTKCMNERRSISPEGQFAVQQKICNLDYLNNISRGNKLLLNKFIDLFLEQTNTELRALEIAITLLNYPAISAITHKLKSCFATMGITGIESILAEMEKPEILTGGIIKIESLYHDTNKMFCLAQVELNQDK